jgi:hypothetical protein
MSRFVLDLTMLEKAVEEQDSEAVKKYGAESLKSGKKATALCSKEAGDSTEAFRLMGTRSWLLGSRDAAIKWFSKSIRIGKSLGARLELARTYREVGRRLTEDGSPQQKLESVDSEGYLKMAESLFEEMDLKTEAGELREA